MSTSTSILGPTFQHDQQRTVTARSEPDADGNIVLFEVSHNRHAKRYEVVVERAELSRGFITRSYRLYQDNPHRFVLHREATGRFSANRLAAIAENFLPAAESLAKTLIEEAVPA